jgi:hypothetical protein
MFNIGLLTRHAESAWTSHGLVDNSWPHNEAASKASGLTPPIMGTAADGIVKHLNVIKDISAREIAGLEE